MKPKNKIQSDPVQSFYDQITVTLSTTNFVLGFIGIGFVFLLVFGALIFCIAFGLVFAFYLLALTFDTPYRLMRHMLGVGGLPPHLIKLPVSRIVTNCIAMVIPVLFLFLGLRGLQTIDFCSQALVCSLGNLFVR
jgi:hypothetical protein